jgi:transcriptional regulator GlxA family with amidase domain
MQDTDRSLDMIAQLSGFGDRDRMRRGFLRVWQQSLLEIRRQFGGGLGGHLDADETHP